MSDVSADNDTLTPHERVVQALEQGGTIPAIARQAEVSPSFAATVADHYLRLGLLQESSSLCTSGLGLCSASSDAKPSAEAAIACAGCPLAR